MVEFTSLRPGILTTTLDEEQTTVTLIVGESQALLIDTGSTPEVGNEIREAVKRETNVPLTTVVLTHGHWDHSFGLGAFADLDTIGHEDLAQDLQCAENLEWAKNHGIDPATLQYPTSLLSAIAVRDLGGLTVEIAHFGRAHTRTDLIVAVPTRAVIAVGDLVEEGPPQFDETSSLDGWVRSLDSLYALLRPDTVVIPGHGQPLDPGYVSHFRVGLAAIWDQSEWAYHQGIPLEHVYDHADLQWPWDRTTAETAIAVAYRELNSPHIGTAHFVPLCGPNVGQGDGPILSHSPSLSQYENPLVTLLLLLRLGQIGTVPLSHILSQCGES